MVALPLGKGAYKRDYAYEPEVRILNRFFETNPTNTTDQTALLARPGTTPVFTTTDTGLVRGFYSTSGLFNSDLFVVIGNSLYRYQPNGTVIPVGGQIYNKGKPSFAFMIGPGYAKLFIADGTLLQYYDGGTKGAATLTATGAITNQVIRVGTSYYTWNASVAGAADGTAALPWIAKIGVDTATSLLSMSNLIDFIGSRGINFSPNLGGASTDVSSASTATTMVLTTKSDLAAANALVTQVISGTGLSWSAATIVGAGVHVLHGVEMPDGKSAKTVASLSSFVLVSLADSGRFYWVQPGANVINGLDFATAESQPDNIIDMISTGDTVWILSGNSTEVWYSTGNLLNPFAPTQGRAYSRGIIEGTSVRIKDQVFVAGTDGIVYMIGRGVQRISDHGIEERIRLQLKRESGT